MVLTFFEKYNKICNENKNTFTLFRRLSGHKNKKKKRIDKFSSISILHSVNAKDDKYYPQAYMEEYKYERIEEVSYFDKDSNSDSDSDFEE